MEFTGERYVPGKVTSRIEADHVQRYAFAATFSESKCVLDIACGTGWGSEILLKGGAALYEGVDIDVSCVEYAIKEFGRPKVSFSVGDICTFRPESHFDLITCFETIEHVSDYRLALNNLHDWLSPGGILIISSPNRVVTSPNAFTINDAPENEFHTQEFLPGELISELQELGFLVSETELYGQRQRMVFGTRFLNSVVRRLCGNPDFRTSARVTRVRNKVPRYFILIARKAQQQ